MEPESKRKAVSLVKSVAILQLKLLLGAARDLVLSPVTLAAAAIDLLRIRHHEPEYFRRAMKAGERSEDWIDLWAAAREPGEPSRESVDLLLSHIEQAVRDPKTGKRRARVLKRWAERQVGARSAEMLERFKHRRDKKDDNSGVAQS
ncbi:MAG TPA: hypothetical protein VH082_00345 [Rudaea sp.]|jgi:hypothetical protein|nr:hypothetical protein [Rudaea sp.]